MLPCDLCFEPVPPGEGQQTADCCLCETCCERLADRAAEVLRTAGEARGGPADEEEDDSDLESTDLERDSWPTHEFGDPVANFPP
jgi:hypothetical protein